MEIIEDCVDLILTSVGSYDGGSYLLENGDAALLCHRERSKVVRERSHPAALHHEDWRV
jgi:hypothetical protein